MFKTLITIPLGYILGFIYSFVQNYGWSLIIFTLIIKVVLLPLGLKQQKATTKMQQVQPKMAEIQKKYANDQQKLSEETMKLYKEYGVNPMGGCLPLLIQLPILFGLYRVIYSPLTYMLHFTDEKVAQLTAQYVEKFGEISGAAANQAQILIAKANDLINFNFLGLDISATPSLKYPSIIWIVPILAAVTTYLTSKVSTAIAGNKNKDKKAEEKKAEENGVVKKERVLSPDQKKNPASANSTESMTKSMTIMMPLMTLWITFTLPATLGVYWTISNLFSILQTILLNGYFKKKLEVEIAAQDILIAEKKALKDARYNKKKKKRG